MILGTLTPPPGGRQEPGRHCWDSIVSKGPGTASGTWAVLTAPGPVIGRLCFNQMVPAIADRRQSKNHWRVKTLPHLFMLQMTSSPLRKSKN